MKARALKGKRSFLVLGWRVTSTLEPRYWLETEAKPGAQSPDDLTMVPAGTMANHTAIIAQSGSGKSFFLGRLIEEIILRTKARCIILDPNADFRRIKEVEDSSLWRNARYDSQRRLGKLPHEASREEFHDDWPTNEMRIRAGRDAGLPGNEFEKLELPWSSVSVEFLAEELDATHRSDLAHCHAVVRNVETLLRLQMILKRQRAIDLIEKCESLFCRARQKPEGEEDLRSFLKQEFDCEKQIRELFKDTATRRASKRSAVLGVFGLEMMEQVFPTDEIKRVLTTQVSYLIECVLKASRYVPKQVEHFYFSKAREYESTGIFHTSVQDIGLLEPVSYRLEVVDIPSLTNRATRLLAINTILETEWNHARAAWKRSLDRPPAKDDRSPTFIVVDEAHNLIPADQRGKAESALREQFRTIIAEGRKYGLFLILVSQRPDKLDPLVLSECENKGVMKLGSRSVLEITRRLLGLDDIQPRLLEKCLEFETGRALLAGPWMPDGPQITYCAARRTVEGGRNLREEHWAVPAHGGRRQKGSRTRKAS